MNVVGSRPDGWWRDRKAAMTRLVSLLDDFADETGEFLTVVFDGRPFDLRRSSIAVAFASTRGLDAADHDIAARVEADRDPGSLTVVTSDRELADRVRSAGAQVLGASAFRRRLEGVSQPDS
jgi:predicted RNA-binding protein with PIN domain